MIATLIMGLVLIGLISGSTFMLMQTMQSNQAVILSQQNVVELQNIKKSILLYSVIQDDKTYVPIGENLLNYHTIPQYVSIKTKNAYRKPYVYCPFAIDIITEPPTEMIKLDTASSYEVKTGLLNYRDTQYNYVVQSDLSPFTNVQAIIISPTSNIIPACQDVYYNNDYGFLVEGGRVEVITSDEIRISKM